uniref:Uncharacterized protein n=1 Tax=Branchiostoma floridae TaxID=7739 RepID=C3Y7B3_BRAFL|eukprot:XP_002607731.1 hypothetical protein BRAFLDRAFT_82822 [Branchiostoma floridae]
MGSNTLCTDRWWFEVRKGDIYAYASGADDVGGDVINVSKTKKPGIVYIEAGGDPGVDFCAVVAKFYVDQNYFCKKFHGLKTAAEFVKKWDDLASKNSHSGHIWKTRLVRKPRKLLAVG